MEIPASVKVGNYVYTVDLTDSELFLDNQRCFGTVDYNNHKIRINKAVQDDQGLFNTFLHELIHAIFHQRSVVLDPESEESIVEELARGLHGVLVDNEGIFEFVVIEEIQYLREENIAACQDFCDKMIYNPETDEYEIETLEGNHLVGKGDYIIKGIAGEFYPCKPDIFDKTYEPV